MEISKDMVGIESLSNLKISDMDFLESKKVYFRRNKKLEISPDFPVEMLPFQCNAFYFTHDFWLNSQTLIAQQVKKVDNHVNVRFASEIILFTLKFLDNFDKRIEDGEKAEEGKKAENIENEFSYCEVTRISPKDIHCRSVVLSFDKKKLILDIGDKFLILDPTNNFKTIKTIDISLNNNYRRGQLSITSNDQWLMYEVNLNVLNPECRNLTEFSTFIQIVNIESGIIRNFAYKKYPFMWNHILCNPTDPKQITAALIQYKEPFPSTQETSQRLWLFDLNKVYSLKEGAREVDIQLSFQPLYNQRKPSLFRKGEIVTHECWSNDGSYLTFIVRRKKIKRVFVETNESEIIMDKGPNPWHCDGHNLNWIVFDTMNKSTGIWICRTNNSGLVNLCKSSTENQGQMHHPHPFFQPGLKYVIFNSDIDGIEHICRVRTNIN